MLEYTDEDVAVFDFDELADHLLEQGQDASPSTLHGCLCGLLAAGAPAQAEADFNAFVAELGAGGFLS